MQTAKAERLASGEPQRVHSACAIASPTACHHLSGMRGDCGAVARLLAADERANKQAKALIAERRAARERKKGKERHRPARSLALEAIAPRVVAAEGLGGGGRTEWDLRRGRGRKRRLVRRVKRLLCKGTKDGQMRGCWVDECESGDGGSQSGPPILVALPSAACRDQEVVPTGDEVADCLFRERRGMGAEAEADEEGVAAWTPLGSAALFRVVGEEAMPRPYVGADLGLLWCGVALAVVTTPERSGGALAARTATVARLQRRVARLLGAKVVEKEQTELAAW